MNRYARQIILPEIGHEGQRRLCSAKVAVIGAGGLGSPVLYCLASAGVGHIHVIDSDAVELTNLNRQFIHFEDDIGREKSQSAKEKLTQYNHGLRICASTVRLDAENVQAYLAGCHAVLSCVDNKSTRYLLNSACVKGGIALIDGGVQGFEGYTLAVLPGITPCYQCVFPKRERNQENAGGVLGAAASVLGSMMAVEAIKYLVGIPIREYFRYLDFLSYKIASVHAKRNPLCPVCQGEGDTRGC